MRLPSRPLLAAQLTALLAVAPTLLAAQSTSTPAPTDPAAFEALWRARQDSARARVHPADVRFMTDMIHHHAQAITMATMAPANGASEPVRILAARIINAQRDEIGIMQRWLGDRHQPVPQLHDMNGAIMVHMPGETMDHDAGGHGGHAMMAGMLTDEQLAALRAARGAAFDRLFLTGMIRHHQGAVTMVEQLFGTDGAALDAAVYRFASDVQVDQRTEVARMQSMLARMGTTP